MKNKGFFKTAAALLAALVLLGGFSVTAYAGGGEDIPTNDSGVIVETEPQPLTPDGNLSLIDDIEGEAAEDKQFIIVQSKNGNYFYIIVDRAAEGENTVHFLNQVDEADLMALMEGDSGKAQAPAVCTCKDKCKAGAVNTACPVCSVNMTECAGKEAVPEPDDAPPEKEKSNAGGIVIFLVVTLLAGGGMGRKLDFIAQEMNREANTILSKTTDLKVSDVGINLKTDIEKVREQIQNIE